MSKQPTVNLRSFRQKVRTEKTGMRRYLSKVEKNAPRYLDRTIAVLEKEVWQQTDCLDCANCCKTMTPTYTNKDIKRIAAHLKMTPNDFRTKWLKQERGGDRDWMNKTEPCQFLDPKTHFCSIYEVRPADCAGFPHLSKKFKDFGHIHKQNVEYCPATYRLVEKMREGLVGVGS